jgi:hypothetical protein
VARFRLRDWLTGRITRFLTHPVGRYEQRYHNDLQLLKRHIRKGDVLLVEGDQRVSAIIKYLTHSSWSHAALYVGDELVRRGGALRDLAVEHFGEEADHLVVEALVEGVVAAPLAKYVDHNVRVCRPHRLRSAHLRSILDESVAAIGWRYDLRNVVDLALYLLAISLLPERKRRDALRFGSGRRTQVICTSLIGRQFQRIGFPVLPSVTFPDAAAPPPPARRLSWLPSRTRPKVYSGVYHRRDPTLLMPRDFDLSPYFEIVKFNVIRERGFDYARIAWDDAPVDDESEPAVGESLEGVRESRREAR